MALLSLVICIFAPILLYGTGLSILYWLSIINLILYIVIILAFPNIIAVSAMRKWKVRVEEMEQQGATEEEIEKIFNEDIEITEKDYQAAPRWLYLINLANIVLGLILLITGILYRMG
ncbi:hypothetical protein [Psychrobacillus sp. FSL H8-0487]|uniref:hypothetical protein n=1 Tax=Psychrobacillus sp. FSL H8-0487 TaxID=2921391 RepID=UPI0030FA2222